jgi:sulfur carrier protein ThiS
MVNAYNPVFRGDNPKKLEVVMNVNMKCFATLVDVGSCNFNDGTVYNLEEGQTVADLIEAAGLKPEDVKIAFVNSKKVGLETVLSEGDRIGLAPATGGM